MGSHLWANSIACFSAAVKRNVVRLVCQSNVPALRTQACWVAAIAWTTDMMDLREPAADVKLGARRRIFFRAEPLRNGGYARTVAALWSASSAGIARSAAASLGDWRRGAGAPPRLRRRQTSIRRHELGSASHVHPTASRGPPRVP